MGTIDGNAKERAMFEEWARGRGFDLTPRREGSAWMNYKDRRTRDRWSGWLFSGSYRGPINMVLHCPACGQQHVDGPNSRLLESREVRGFDETLHPWTNPPHRSHLCHYCGHVWRPADVCTNGVAAVTTAGKNDSPIGR